MIETTQKLMKEIETLSNDNLLLRASRRDLENQYDKLRETFNELLEIHLEMREKWGFGEFIQDYKYEWIDKAGLTDSY
jgi:predicted nuclease with TOPRIM domain